MRVGSLQACTSQSLAASRLAPCLLAMSSAASSGVWSAADRGVLWDVDGTLVESTRLAFDATNEVLEANGVARVSVDDYKVGCRYTTPERCAVAAVRRHASRWSNETSPFACRLSALLVCLQV